MIYLFLCPHLREISTSIIDRSLQQGRIYGEGITTSMKKCWLRKGKETKKKGKQLLSEATIRKFMKLANLEELSENFLQKIKEEEDETEEIPSEEPEPCVLISLSST